MNTVEQLEDDFAEQIFDPVDNKLQYQVSEQVLHL
jgi:hypothetical protein